MEVLLSPFFWTTLVMGPGVGLLGLTAAVFLHELGHATVARYYGMRITHFRVRPWGGHCSFADDARSDEVYYNPIRRGILYAAGALANILAACTCLLLVQWNIAPEANFYLLLLAAVNSVLAIQVVLCTNVSMSDGAEVVEAWQDYRESQQLKRS